MHVHLIIWSTKIPRSIVFQSGVVRGASSGNPLQRLGDGVGGRGGLLPHQRPHQIGEQRRRRHLLHQTPGTDHAEERPW